MAIEVTPVEPALPGDGEGSLIFRNGILLAVVSRLGPDGDRQGCWHVEAVFDVMGVSLHSQFSDMTAVCQHFETLGLTL